MSDVKLPPCPLCGQDVEEHGHNLIGIEIECSHCGLSLLAKNRATAYPLWRKRTRAADPTKVLLVEALREVTAAYLAFASTHFIDTGAVTKSKEALAAYDAEQGEAADATA